MGREFFYILGFLLGILAATVGLTEASGRWSCSNYERITGIESKWIFMDDCYVNAGGKWQRWEEYKARAITNEINGSD